MEATKTFPFFAHPSVLLWTKSGVPLSLVLRLYLSFPPATGSSLCSLFVPGIRAGRDELLEVAIRQIVPRLSPSQVEELARSSVRPLLW